MTGETMTDVAEALDAHRHVDRYATASRWPLIATAGLLGTVTNAVAFMLPPLLPDMQSQYHLGVAAATWVFTAMVLGAGAGMVLIPRLSDLRGDRYAASMSGVLMIAGALLAAIGQTYTTLLVGAILMGFGSASQILPIAFLRRLLPGNAIGVAVSVPIIATGVGVVVGMTGGGIMVKDFSLNAFFYTMAVAFALTTLALIATIPAGRPAARGRIGIPGAVWLIGWVAVVLLALSQGTVWKGSLPYLVLAGGLVGGIVWMFAERRSSTAVFDLQLLRRPYISTSVISTALFGAVDSALLLLVTYYVQTPTAAGYGLGYDPLKTSYLMLPFALTMFVSGTAAERYVAKGKPGLVLVFGAAVCALGLIWLAVAHDQAWQYLVGSGIVGLGSRAGYSGAFAIPQYAVPEEDAGMVLGMGGTTMAIGFAFGSALITAVLASATNATTGLPKESLYASGYLISVGLPIVVVIACALSRLRHPTGYETHAGAV